ncbi:phosphoribosyltransferase [Amycolatopsis magusensis]|uniref:phosphoribosyltransferase n=1 Tax=Amycolatopsis magusensis TaxID=882444 RepID=UPI0024A8D983|nr:hypothetical protein [Amycolatopsis magusensis]MDI5978773.1 hypothetical protein [Amycolatopsis magusensis]
MTTGEIGWIRDFLVRNAGGYLRNTVLEAGVTCAVCATPVSAGYRLCRSCDLHERSGKGKLADAVSSLVYAVQGEQSHWILRGYKADSPVEEHVRNVRLLCNLGLMMHMRCMTLQVGRKVTNWAAVPSLPAKPGEHALHKILVTMLPVEREIELVAADKVEDTRALSHEHFRPATPFSPGAHVLVIDDTWTTGGHAQSAVLALRTAGAETVSIMNVARYLKERYADNAEFVREKLTSDYDPAVCPWTGRGCP